MAIVNKSVLLEYSAEQMFALVDGIENYPQFLPWCGGAQVRRNGDNSEVIAQLTLDIGGFKKNFTTKNFNVQPGSITMTLVDGPFSKLDGGWTFKALREDACKVELNLEYDLTGHPLAFVIDQVFGAIAGSMVEAFTQRAKSIYG